MIPNKPILDKALDIFKVLLARQEISREDDRDLYEDYLYNGEVEEMVRYIADKLELEIYHYHEKIFMTPGIDNKLFGYTNEELRESISYIKNNSGLYTAYFVMLVLITVFYKQSGPDTTRRFVNLTELTDITTKKFEAMLKLDDLEAVSSEQAFNFTDVAKVWQGKVFAKQTKAGEISEIASTTKYGFVFSVCRFLEEQKLIKIVKDQGWIVPTDRFKAIIYNFYEDKEHRAELLEFVYNLGIEGDGSHAAD
ncbi:MAG: hypothetical protein GXY50_11350 [Syntrophomonadaceae bacterium]|nr:hypothetical protein [Syntrophomonadaceae bacterium]